jgi:hypothetical protein
MAIYTPPTMQWADLINQIAAQDANRQDATDRSSNGIYSINGLPQVQAIYSGQLARILPTMPKAT